MRTITVKNLWIQFDADEVTGGDDRQQALTAIDLINGVLQREPYGLGAQIFSSHIDNSDIESEEVTEYKELQQCILDGTHLITTDEDGYCNFCGEQSPVSEQLEELVEYIRNNYPGTPMTLNQIKGFLLQDWQKFGMEKSECDNLLTELHVHAEKVGYDCLYSVLNPD